MEDFETDTASPSAPEAPETESEQPNAYDTEPQAPQSYDDVMSMFDPDADPAEDTAKDDTPPSETEDPSAEPTDDEEYVEVDLGEQGKVKVPKAQAKQLETLQERYSNLRKELTQKSQRLSELEQDARRTDQPDPDEARRNEQTKTQNAEALKKWQAERGKELVSAIDSEEPEKIMDVLGQINQQHGRVMQRMLQQQVEKMLEERLGPIQQMIDETVGIQHFEKQIDGVFPQLSELYGVDIAPELQPKVKEEARKLIEAGHERDIQTFLIAAMKAQASGKKPTKADTPAQPKPPKAPQRPTPQAPYSRPAAPQGGLNLEHPSREGNIIHRSSKTDLM